MHSRTHCNNALSGRKLTYSQRRQEWLNWVVQVERAGLAEPVVPGERVARAERVAQAERAAQFLVRRLTPTPIRSWWMRSSHSAGRDHSSSRESGRPHSTWYYAPGLPPTIDDVTQMERWEPWVRAYIAIGEMMRGIDFQTSGNAFQGEVIRLWIPIIADLGN